MSTSPRSAGYHHGDLPNALMEAALELLEEAGDEATLSLRAVARRAGVSPNAPYRHYPDKDALLAALATRGFHDLRDRMAAADTAAPAGGEFTALAQAYLTYAIDHPGQFRLMFGHPCSKAHPETVAAAAEATAVLSTRVSSTIPAAQRDAFLTGCWALVHGLASLVLDGKLTPDDPEHVATLTRDVIAAMFNSRLDGGSAVH